MFALKKALTALLLPPTSLLLLALLGLWLARRHPRTGRALTIGSLLALLVLSMPWTASKLQQSLETHPPISAAELSKVDAIVVLCGGVYRATPEYGGDTINAFSLERARYAAHLYRQHQRPILVTGGAPSGGAAEGVLMAQVLRDDFATPVRWIESGSLDTVDNARLSAIMLKQAEVKHIALVSHGWHLQRAIPLFEQQGLTVTAAPTLFTGTADHALDFLPGSGLKTSRQGLHEWLGIVANHLSGATAAK